MPVPAETATGSGAAGGVEAVYARIARRIMPVLILLFVIAWLDRVNVGFMLQFAAITEHGGHDNHRKQVTHCFHDRGIDPRVGAGAAAAVRGRGCRPAPR